MNVEAELAPPEDGDACVICEEPVDDQVAVVTVATSLTPDECVTVCLRCAKAIAKEASRL